MYLHAHVPLPCVHPPPSPSGLDYGYQSLSPDVLDLDLGPPGVTVERRTYYLGPTCRQNLEVSQHLPGSSLYFTVISFTGSCQQIKLCYFIKSP